MEIFVNGNRLDFKLENETHFGQVYENLADWVKQGNKKVWSLKIDQEPYDIAHSDTFSSLTLETIGRVDLSVGEPDAGAEMAKKASFICQTLDQVKDLVNELVKDIHTGEEKNIATIWPQILKGLSVFNETFPYYAALGAGDKADTIHAKFDKYKGVLQDILNSIEVKDNVSLCDQLQYELGPQIDEWKQFMQEVKKTIRKGNGNGSE